MKSITSLLLSLPIATLAFSEVDTNFLASTHVVPAAPIQSKVIFRGYVDTVTTANGTRTPAKDWHDFSGYMPINGRSDSGYLVISHEMITKDAILGDGGGMTVMTVAMQNGEWKVIDDPKGKFRATDFSTVGGTLANCGGARMPNGNFMTAEEWGQTSNKAIMALVKDPKDTTKMVASGITDTSDFTITEFNGKPISKTIKRYQNFNWMVEVDPTTNKAVRKMYHMGRFDHEGGTLMPDNKTVYLTDDYTPAVFFKFVADVAGNYNVGQLYAYKQSADGASGEWITIPMNIDTMLVVRDWALRNGATTFTRHEWIDNVDGKVYLTETGRDKSDAHYQASKNGATIAKHLRERLPAGTTVTLYNGEKKGDSTVTDYYGRVLVFDPATNKMSVLIEGGAGVANTAKHLSNPDGIYAGKIGDKSFLLIQEDLNGLSQGRVSPEALAANRTICEAYLFDLSMEPKVDNLKRIYIGPAGSEVTGGIFTPDGKTMFINSQHPSSKLAAPYNTSFTTAVWGFDLATTGLSDRPLSRKGFQMDVDAASRFVRFNKTISLNVFDGAGRSLAAHRNVNAIDIAAYRAGVYFLDAGKLGVHKLVIQ